ncbi:MAG: pyridine nucleotide-disulfide oxidoreductase, partial [Gammaproteobacteria bacterium]
RFMRNWGNVSHWFRLHMILGIIGPLLVLFHSNFSLGSTNSNLALFSMLLVAGSGLIGRYIYTRIHFGVYGQQASLKEIRENLQITKGKLSEQFKLSGTITTKIRAIEKRLLKKRIFFVSILLLPFIPIYTYGNIFFVVRAIRKDIRRQARQNGWDNKIRKKFSIEANSLLVFYIKNVRRAAELNIYRQLFSLWHLLHMPLFITLKILWQLPQSFSYLA